jgi:hypothetical protein
MTLDEMKQAVSYKQVNFELRRKWLTKKSTIGELLLDGRFECFTLEDQVGPSGDSKGCIPAGRYRLGIRQSKRFGKLMIALYDVPGFEGILIHNGNSFSDTLGCILVGKSRGPQPDWIGRSGIALADLFPKVSEACEWGDQHISIYDAEVPAAYPSTAGLAGKAVA